MFLSLSRGECSVVRMDFRKNTAERASARSWLGLIATLGPVLVVAIQDGVRGVREVGPVALLIGAVFSGGQ